MSEKKFLDIDYDEFNEKTTTKHKNTLQWGGLLNFSTINEYSGITLRHVKTKALDALCLDLNVKAKDWFHARNGSLILNCDQDNQKLEYNESQTDVQTIGENAYCFEYGYYSMSKEQLEKVCEANVLKIRISGTTYEDIKEDDVKKFHTYCKQFYNNFYDDSKYTDSLSEDVGSSGGCFIATAAMGDYNDPTVVSLRVFRDEYLARKSWGRGFTKSYYNWAPSLATVIEKNIALRKLSYYLIVKPLEKISIFLLKK